MKLGGKCQTQATSPANAHIFTAIIGRRGLIASLATAAVALGLLLPTTVAAQSDPLPSWNEGPTKTAIIEFVKATTEEGGPKFVPPEARIATFDQDGTTWVEQPMYTQVMYCLDRVPALAEKKPELKNVEPFKTVLSGDREAMAKLPKKALEEILVATLTGMTVEEFTAEVKPWMATAKHPRFKRLYTELTYLPMLEVMRLFRDNGYKTYFVTGGGQDFVRVYSEATYGVPAEHVVGSAGEVKFGYDKNGRPILTKEPKLLLDDDKAGKPEGIHLVIGRRPVAAFGNSIGDKEMLEFTQGGDGARLMALVHHDDAEREYAYGPDSKVGTFPDVLMEEAKSKGWFVISMKNDWKRIFAFD
jgi:haloacid dehalogenase-like hydrolase